MSKTVNELYDNRIRVKPPAGFTLDDKGNLQTEHVRHSCSTLPTEVIRYELARRALNGELDELEFNATSDRGQGFRVYIEISEALEEVPVGT